MHPLALEKGFWYLASPYSKHPEGPEYAFKRICWIAACLIKRGVPLYCPIAHSHHIALEGDIGLGDHATWLALDERFIEAAHGLIVAKMRSWETSYGVTWEIERFRDMEKPIHYLNPPLTSKGELHGLGLD